jgi:glycosyltransferase involved in cell wall biosynthesis
MKITLLCNEYPPRPHGGIGTFVQTIARAFSALGHKVTVVGLGGATEESRDGEIRIVSLAGSKTRFIGNLISRLRLRKWLYSEAKAGNIDVIEVPDYLGLLPFGARGCCTVVRLHVSTTAICLQAGLKIPRGITFYERRTLLANSNWVGVSQYILDSTKEIFGVSPQRSVRIYNPVPSAPTQLPDVPGLPENFVLYAGQISKRKGALVLAEAGRELLANRPELHLVYVGGEVLLPGARSIAEQAKDIVGPALAARVHFLGRVNREQVLTCMRRAKVYAFPSSLEALPLVVLEAMSCGLPVVCTSAPPGPEIIEDGVSGLLADPANPKDFSKQIGRLLDDPSLANRLADSGRRAIAERFTLERCISETLGFYKECIHHRNG